MGDPYEQVEWLKQEVYITQQEVDSYLQNCTLKSEMGKYLGHLHVKMANMVKYLNVKVVS